MNLGGAEVSPKQHKNFRQPIKDNMNDILTIIVLPIASLILILLWLGLLVLKKNHVKLRLSGLGLNLDLSASKSATDDLHHLNSNKGDLNE